MPETRPLTVKIPKPDRYIYQRSGIRIAKRPCAYECPVRGRCRFAKSEQVWRRGHSFNCTKPGPGCPWYEVRREAADAPQA